MKKTILLDMDGVIVDFVGGVFKRLGEPPKGYKPVFEINTWYNMNSEKFWDMFSDFDFWSELEPYFGHEQYHKFITQLAEIGNIVYCTTPSYSPMSAAGKLYWLQKSAWSCAIRNYSFTSDKWRLAAHDTILIDDFEKNIDIFNAVSKKRRCKNCYGILVPRPWNKFGRHVESYDEILTLVSETIK